MSTTLQAEVLIQASPVNRLLKRYARRTLPNLREVAVCRAKTFVGRFIEESSTATFAWAQRQEQPSLLAPLALTSSSARFKILIPGSPSLQSYYYYRYRHPQSCYSTFFEDSESYGQVLKARKLSAGVSQPRLNKWLSTSIEADDLTGPRTIRIHSK
jgi:hypothetical protein